MVLFSCRTQVVPALLNWSPLHIQRCSDKLPISRSAGQTQRPCARGHCPRRGGQSQREAGGPWSRGSDLSASLHCCGAGVSPPLTDKEKGRVGQRLPQGHSGRHSSARLCPWFTSWAVFTVASPHLASQRAGRQRPCLQADASPAGPTGPPPPAAPRTIPERPPVTGVQRPRGVDPGPAACPWERVPVSRPWTRASRRSTGL